MRGYRITPIGVVLLAVVIGGVLLALLGSGSARGIGGAAAVLVLLLLVGEGVGGEGGDRKAEVFQQQAEIERLKRESRERLDSDA